MASEEKAHARHCERGAVARWRRPAGAAECAERKSYAGLRSFPSGHMEVGESLEQTLVRELGEEIEITPLDFRKVAEFPDPNAPDGSIVYHMFVVGVWQGDPAIRDHEHSELRWFGLREARALPDLALPGYRDLFAAIAG